MEEETIPTEQTLDQNKKIIFGEVAKSIIDAYDEDGVDEPYIITVHVNTRKVVRVMARYAEDTIIARFEDERPQPFLQPSLTRVDFLTTTDQANNGCPILMSIHDANQKFWLRRVESCLASLLSHEL